MFSLSNRLICYHLPSIFVSDNTISSPFCKTKVSGNGRIRKRESPNRHSFPEWWEKLDLNQRSLSATDLQSAPFDRALAFSLIWWDLQESNLGRADLQSAALPSELRFHNWLQGRDSNPHKAVYETAVLPIYHPAVYLVHEARVELASPFGHRVLSAARLPVPPLVHMARSEGIEPPASGIGIRHSLLLS